MTKPINRKREAIAAAWEAYDEADRLAREAYDEAIEAARKVFEETSEAAWEAHSKATKTDEEFVVTKTSVKGS